MASDRSVVSEISHAIKYARGQMALNLPNRDTTSIIHGVCDSAVAMIVGMASLKRDVAMDLLVMLGDSPFSDADKQALADAIHTKASEPASLAPASAELAKLMGQRFATGESQLNYFTESDWAIFADPQQSRDSKVCHGGGVGGCGSGGRRECR